MDVTTALLRYTVPVERSAARIYRAYRGLIEFDELHITAMERVAGYATSGKLDEWEEKGDPYICTVLEHDLQDFVIHEQRQQRRQRGERPGRFAAPVEQGPAPRTLRRWRKEGFSRCGLPLKRVTDDEKAEIARLRKQGLGARAIATILERERDTVLYWTRKFDRA